MQRLAQARDKALLCQCPVAQLAALVVDDHPDLGSEAIDDALALHRTERRGRLEIEPQLDPRVRPIGVLTARSARRGVGDDQLVTGHPNRSGDGKYVRHEARLS